MARKSNTRTAAGAGSIRQRADGSWEGRCVTGYDPGTGKPLRRSVYAKTQKEARKKLAEIIALVDTGAYQAPCRITVGEWLDIWADTYLGGCKARTVVIYKDDIRLHIKPALAAIRLEALTTPAIQAFYNSLIDDKRLSPKTVKNIHGVLHSALRQAGRIGYIRFNPADACILPRGEKKEIKPLDEAQIAAFLQAIQGSQYEDLFALTLFTGMREGEALGLTWDCVDFNSGAITINKQMQLHQEGGLQAYALIPTKNSRTRTVIAAPSLLDRLQRQRKTQAAQRLAAGPLWDGRENLVFTNAFGQHLTKPTIYRAFKRAAASIGRPDARFHDLRHSYAVAALQSGDDVKTVQSNLGHATAAFTLDVYGHVTARMKQDSAARMETFIKSVSNV